MQVNLDMYCTFFAKFVIHKLFLLVILKKHSFTLSTFGSGSEWKFTTEMSEQNNSDESVDKRIHGSLTARCEPVFRCPGFYR